MRTLKKALSLVLVLAMVLSLGVSAFAVDKASQFSDYGTVTNKEAVDVLTAIGVISGNTDGTFGPTGNFTRGQAATMISYLKLGKTVAAALPTSATQFTDVPATHWAAKYVQYCATQGIINGYGDGKFGVDDPLTASQWALMLLGALGYNAANEQIGGAGWEIQVTTLALQAKIATPEDLAGTFNRDVAAKMALKTLEAKTVSYTGGTSVSVNGVEFKSGAVRVAGTDELYKNSLYALTKLPTTSDELDRPAHTWQVGTTKKTTIGVYANTPAVRYTSAVQSGTVYADLGLSANATVTATVNGGAATPVTLNINKNDKTEGNVIGGNGYITEIFTDNDGNITDAVMVKPSFGQVKTVERKETKSVGAYTQYTVGGASGKVFSTVVNSDADKDTAKLTGSVANNDYVMYYVVGTGASGTARTLYIEAVDTITGTLTSVSSKGVLTIDGTAYSKAAYGASVAPNKDAQSFYVDAYGNIIEATAAVDNTKYAMVLSKDAPMTLNGTKLETTYNVTVVEADGTIATLTVANKAAYDAATEGTVYAYTTNSKGVSTLGAVDAAKATTANVGTITNKSADLGTIKANSNTKFFFADWTKNEDTNTREVTNTVTSYTGTAAVPSYTGLTKATALDTNKDGIADVVFVHDDKSATVADQYVYVVGNATTTVDGTQFDVIIKGEPDTMTITAGAVPATGMYSSLTIANGAASGTRAVAEPGIKGVKNNGNVWCTSTADDGTGYTASNKTIADDVAVYVIIDGAVTPLTAADITGGYNADEVYVVLNTAGTAVTTVYLVING